MYFILVLHVLINNRTNYFFIDTLIFKDILNNTRQDIYLYCLKVLKL